MSGDTSTVGGFLALELPTLRGELPPPSATLFRSGRACLRAILESERPRRFLAPYYVCDAAIAPALALDVPVIFYEIDRELSPLLPETRSDDAILLVDYFGVGAKAISRYVSLPGIVIVDQTQALFACGPESTWRFTSARKWFGVPDGGFLWGPRALPAQAPRPLASLPTHLVERRWGDPARAYVAYLSAEANFDTEIAPISTTSVSLLRGVDADLVRVRRRRNFEILHSRLAAYNTLETTLPLDGAPFCYPFLPQAELSREALAREGIYVPQFWADCLARGRSGFDWEKDLSCRLLPLPLDHRYVDSDMLRVADRVEHLIRQVAG